MSFTCVCCTSDLCDSSVQVWKLEDATLLYDYSEPRAWVDHSLAHCITDALLWQYQMK